MDAQQFCLKWDDFQSSVTSLLDSLRKNDELVDITLCCEGQKIRAHRIVLSACSPYFRSVLKDLPCQQLVFFLKDTSAADLKAIVEFMYKGSINIAQSQLAGFIKTAEMLQIRGLSEEKNKAPEPKPSSPRHQEPDPSSSGPSVKRRRTSTLATSDVLTSQVIEVCTQLSPEHVDSVSPAIPVFPSSFTSNAVKQTMPVAGSASCSSPMVMQSEMPHEPVKTQDRPVTTAYRGTEQYGSARTVEPNTDSNVVSVKTELLDDVSNGDDMSAGPSKLEPEYEDTYCDETYTNMNSEDGRRRIDLLDPSDIAYAAADGGLPKECFRCEECGQTFMHRVSMDHHRKVHEGSTVCPVCFMVTSRVSVLRRHLRYSHKMSDAQVRSLIPTRTRRTASQMNAGSLHN